MAHYRPLNNIEHKDLKVMTDFAPKYGDNITYAVTFPQEFRAVQASYPIFFTKDSETGRFYPVAIFGLREGENLFLSDEGWDANYIPVTVKKNPFMLGFQRENIDGGTQQKMIVSVDMDSPRLSNTEGEAIFLPHGGNSKFLEDVVTMLDYINVGHQAGEYFIAELLKHSLLEPFSLDVELKNGSKNQLLGFYTINEDRLAELKTEVVDDLHTKGLLFPIYMVIASMSNVETLISKIERRIA
jgi:hypothetical protein